MLTLKLGTVCPMPRVLMSVLGPLVIIGLITTDGGGGRAFAKGKNLFENC